MNAWALLYDELYGDDKMSDDNRVTPQESDEYDPKLKPDVEDSDWNDPVISSGDSINIGTDFSSFTVNDDYFVGVSTASAADIADCASAYFVDTSDYEVTIDTSNFDTVTFGGEVETPAPGIESNNPRKYKEDEAIKALQDYISTTYGGHYTSKENNVQTLDLIESVGDAESFCRSNAIKYLSRYDKKGQAKRDILKALHYSLLLYHFSGQLKETTTRGYETF
jgi:hypothetical protein